MLSTLRIRRTQVQVYRCGAVRSLQVLVAHSLDNMTQLAVEHITNAVAGDDGRSR